MQLYMRRYGSDQLSAGADSAILAWPVPNEARFNYMRGECHIFAVSATTPGSQVGMYGAQGWILQSVTPGDFEVMNTLWDRFVPKDNDVVDLDSVVTVDTDSMFEPGLISVSQMLDQEVGNPHRWFNKSEIVSFMTSYRNFSPTVTTHHLNDFFNFGIKNAFKMRDNAGIVFGVGSPDMAGAGVDTDVIEGTSGHSFDGFFTLKHLEDFLDKAMLEATPFTEAGAESPYEDIMNFLIDTLEEVNENVALFEARTWNIWGRGTAGIEVPGRLSHVSLGPDSQA